ncbi:hypothetical protein KAR91_24605 [Candidatus Pacearchaeota archaeon]|nr:hypothetical protein [Candidatus Pacearchaeota archaeon]
MAEVEEHQPDWNYIKKLSTPTLRSRLTRSSIIDVEMLATCLLDLKNQLERKTNDELM